MKLDRQSGFPAKGIPGLYWLGQAGFWIETGQHSILIDPYLSDSLAHKYGGKKGDYARMMSPPITVDQLPRPDVVLVTHAHTDHMDPDTLGPLYKRFPDTLFIVPHAVLQVAKERINAVANISAVDGDQELSILEGLKIHIFPAAHEDLRCDEYGHHFFLGYGIEADGLKIYHSGDCIPFDGLSERVAAFAPNIALLPVNGRDADRLANGVPGNFTLEEAIELSQGTPILIPHHFGMFAFNTLDPEKIDEAATKIKETLIYRPKPGETLLVKFRESPVK